MRAEIITMVAILVVVGSVLSFRSCRRNLDAVRTFQDAALPADSARYWKDAHGREHARAQAAEADRRSMMLAYGQLVDSMARLNQVKAKQIEEIIWLSTQIRGQRTMEVLNNRQEGHTDVSIAYSSPFLEVSGSGRITDDSLSDLDVTYELRDSLIITRIRRPDGWFRKATYIDVVSTNPHVRLTGLRSLVIRDKPKRFGIGLQLGYMYTGSRWQPAAGLGLSYNIIRF